MPQGNSVWNDILKEVDATNPAWLGGFVPVECYFVEAASNQFIANETQRALVQQMGAAHGCHTCNKHIENTTQTFIVDHIPPRAIFSSNPTAAAITYRFFPHCDECASKQSRLVQDIKDNNKTLLHELQKWCGQRSEKELADIRRVLKGFLLDEFQIKLLTGGSGPSYSGHGGDPTRADRERINNRTKPIACHSCDRQQALFIYHADHCPPKEFAMTYWFKNSIRDLATADDIEKEVKEIISKIEVNLARSFFRPQCPTCSHTQGGRCQHLVEIVQAELKKRPHPVTMITRGNRKINVNRYGKEQIDE